ncbi:MAG: hypothetical protein CM1200mP28_03230 [Deltaproteobacteria bacterium]|nr:MAG: hypothetical protein CM1200mP28_03230 [Deltaproteobacteria bacterium]
MDQKVFPDFLREFLYQVQLYWLRHLIMLGKSLEINSPEINFWAQFCSFLMVFAAILMVSFPIRYMHIGRLMSREEIFNFYHQSDHWIRIYTIFRHVALTYLFLYVLSPLYTWRINPDLASREQPGSSTLSI